ncbi:uncharacterized protein LODBEIA_P04160 [Lodderomyces beijingensis]|uniref:SUN domain-containing protein n=1 Tax=Lodderomyces beijingensis TaxID=1775926 RepID=A0ABP0ZDF1_9ASCO
MLQKWLIWAVTPTIFSALTQANPGAAASAASANASESISPLRSPLPVFLIQGNHSAPLTEATTEDGSSSLLLQTPVEGSAAKEDERSVHNDSIIDACHFMSFEEWKRQKIESDNDSTNNSKNQTLAKKPAAEPVRVNITDPATSGADSNSSSDAAKKKNKKKVNGKVYKDKFNFASMDCGATIVETNAQAKGASAILKENKDTYLLNQCSVHHKYVIIELCQDILVGQVSLGNFEFFSSMFKDIKVSVSDRFPAKEWKEIGIYQAQNSRELQSFNIENPLIWARFLRVDILSHYGNEFYCPISLIRVHGKTMIDEFKEERENHDRDHDVSYEVAKVETANENSVDNDTLLLNDTMNECRVVLPHLRLNEFLRDYNATTQELCLPNEANSLSTSASTASASTKTTQESIYKNIMKRLSLLESNATLSLLYVEEQSKLLSTAFSNLERRQSTNFNNLISSVNATLLNQLMTFKDSYSLLHDQYANLLRLQELSYKQYLKDSAEQIRHLNNEMSFQKKVSLFNSFLIVCLLAYLALTRDINIEVQERFGDVGDEKKSASKEIADQVIVPEPPQ